MSLEEINERNHKSENVDESKEIEENKIQSKEDSQGTIKLGAHLKSILPMLRVFGQPKPA